MDGNPGLVVMGGEVVGSNLAVSVLNGMYALNGKRAIAQTVLFSFFLSVFFSFFSTYISSNKTNIGKFLFITKSVI